MIFVSKWYNAGDMRVLLTFAIFFHLSALNKNCYFDMQTSGWIAAPDSDGDGCYDYNLNCLYTVLGRKNEVFEFQVLYVDIEASTGCKFDYLSVSI